MTSIKIPTPLRAFTDGEAKVNVTGDTVGTALRDLVQQYPDLRPHLYDEQNQLRSFVNVYLGDEDVRFLSGQDTELAAGDDLRIIPSIAGGR